MLHHRSFVFGMALVLLSSLVACSAGETVTASEGESIQISAESATDADRAAYLALADIDPPPADPIAIAVSIKGVDPATLPVAPEQPERTYQVGDRREFWTHNNSTSVFTRVEAKLMYISEYAYFWQHISSDALNASGKEATPEDWAESGHSFDQSYERVRAVFGHEEWPGLDGDPRLFVIHSDTLGKVGGYFGQGDLLPVEIEHHSNEGQYFFVSNNWSSGIASEYYKEVLAHEFQHMIHKNVDPNEEGWLNEGLSMLAQQVAGMRGDNFVADYLVKPDQSLWYWGSGSEDYGQAYLYIEYLYEQLGEDFISDLVAEPANGLTGIEKILAESGADRSADELYADALTAAFFNNPAVNDGLYSFTAPSLIPIKPRYEFTSASGIYTGTTEQYGGADIMTFSGRGKKVLRFTGDQRTRLLPADAHSGDAFWWSSRQDSSLSTLTRQVDLTGVSDAELTYWAWYDIEEDWDYAYLMASTDNGEHWTIVPASSSRSGNPNAQNLGYGFSGRSGRGEEAVWIQEEADLRAFTGKKILLRFAMQNDLAVNEFGFAVDDLAIPAIGWSDDAESGEAGWTAEGFVLTQNRIPQIWRVRAVEQLKSGSLRVNDLEVTGGAAEAIFDLSASDRIVVFVIGQTRYTTIPASYRLELGTEP